ncbi:MAG: hypothetical protein FWD71_04025 [Oscillospiraceae bacterium]|nr:hypothetical protein [Oscillospiraceae bacterium]
MPLPTFCGIVQVSELPVTCAPADVGSEYELPPPVTGPTFAPTNQSDVKSKYCESVSVITLFFAIVGATI